MFKTLAMDLFVHLDHVEQFCQNTNNSSNVTVNHTFIEVRSAKRHHDAYHNGLQHNDTQKNMSLANSAKNSARKFLSYWFLQLFTVINCKSCNHYCF
jgi:hypothetical protein